MIKRTILVAFLLGLLAFGVTLRLATWRNPPVIQEAQVIVIKTPAMETILTDWVYSNSAKISRDTAKEIVTEAMDTGIPLLILALMYTESDFVPTAVSSVGALGLTQVRWEIHSQALVKAGIAKERRDLFNVGPSIKAGNLILSDNLKSSGGNIEIALEKYLGGRDGVYVKRICVKAMTLYVLTQGVK